MGALVGFACRRPPDPSAPCPVAFSELDAEIDDCRNYEAMKRVAGKYGCETWGQFLMVVWLPLKNTALGEDMSYMDWREDNGFELLSNDSLRGHDERMERIREALANPTPQEPPPKNNKGTRRATLTNDEMPF